MHSLGLSGEKVLKAVGRLGGYELERFNNEWRLTGDGEPLVVTKTVRELVKQGLLVDRKAELPQLTAAGSKRLEGLSVG